jgi:hypothetical protein
MQQMLQQLLANQEKVEVDRIADQECMKQMKAEMKTDRKAHQARTDAEHKEIMAKIDAETEDI